MERKLSKKRGVGGEKKKRGFVVEGETDVIKQRRSRERGWSIAQGRLPKQKGTRK